MLKHHCAHTEPVCVALRRRKSMWKITPWQFSSPFIYLHFVNLLPLQFMDKLTFIRDMGTHL